MLGQIGFYSLGVGVFLVYLVDCNNHRHIRRSRVLNCFYGLGHGAVIRCNHQYHDVRSQCTTRAHGTESGVTRGIEKGDFALVVFDAVGTDVLRDTARLAGSNMRSPDVIEQ